jgi:hypothetical protein
MVWPGTRAVLLVHGIGDASTGKDGAFPLDMIKQALGSEAPNVAIYRINYDFINDWLTTKVQFQAGLAALKAHLKQKFGSEDLDATIAEYAGDVLWPILSTSLRFAVRDAIVAQLIQMKMDRRESALARGDDPRKYEISVIAHSLGCFHTYEVLAAAAQEPAHALRPGSNLFTLKSVILMASPVQLIRSVAGAMGALVPDTGNLATLASSLSIPSEVFQGATIPITKKFMSITGSHDPVGGHLLGKKLDWAYMDIPGQQSVIVPQNMLNIDTKAGTAAALAQAFAAGGPKVNDPHSWSAYVTGESNRVREALFT